MTAWQWKWGMFACTVMFITQTLVGLEPGRQPNIVILLADDLGYGDLGCQGHPQVKTPNIDRLAREGVRFTSFYSGGANCSPARTALMTGRTPNRVGIYNAIPTLSPMHLRSSEITVAKILQRAGYQTAHVGKWHLNGFYNYPNQPQPNDHGFDYWFGTQNNALPNHRQPYNFVRNGIPMGPIEGFAGAIVADEATDWLKDKRDKSKPFFLYVCFHEPHEPISTSPEHAAHYGHQDPAQVAFLGNVTQLDASVGKVLRTIDEIGERENTLVLFTSDNGPAITPMHPYGSSGNLRGKKGTVYDGGVRVPGIIRWPKRVARGQTNDQPIGFVDVLPTLCELTGQSPPDDRTLDGESFLLLLDQRDWRRTKPLYWQFNASSEEPKVAMRDGDWKILASLDRAPTRRVVGIGQEAMDILKHARLKDYQLYHIRNDMGEANNLAAKEPQVLAAMTAKLNQLFDEIQSESPVWPIWDDPQYEQLRIQWPDYWLKKSATAPGTKSK